MNDDPSAAPQDHGLPFLQSALLVDDRASFRRDPANQDQPTGWKGSPLEEPAEEVIHDADTRSATTTSLSADTPEPTSRDIDFVDDIDPQLLVEAFADLGVACATLAPRETIGIDRTRVLALAANTDIVILDWILRDPDGKQGDRDNQLGVQATNSRDLLKDILRADAARGGRLRLLCIYTGDRNLTGIADQVAEVVREIHGNEVQKNIDRLEVTGPDLRVVLLAKTSNDASGVPRVSEKELAGRLVDEFKTFADGLLRRVALAGLAAVRGSAHRLLVRFPADLDPAFLSHRALVGPTDADEWATQLIADEIATVVAAAAHAGELLGEAAVNGVVDHMLPKSAQGRRMLLKPNGKAVMPVETDTARRLFKLGRAVADLRDKDVDGAVLERAASVTLLLLEADIEGNDVRQAAFHDDALAAVSCLARDPRHEGREHPPPVLGLGTLLVTDDVYFLCLQPLCDTVRLRKATPFPLLPLKRASDGDPFDITVPTDAEPIDFVRLRSTSGRLRDLQQHLFEPTGDSVKAEFRERAGQPTRWTFESVVESDQPGRTFHWAGDVRSVQASRCALRLSQSASRPGLLESEYQRVRAGH